MSQSPPNHASLQEAAQWYARLRAESADPALTQGWQQWLAANADHRHAWAFVERVSQRFEPLQEQPEASVQALQTARHRGYTRRRTLGTLSLLLGGTLLGWAGWRSRLLPQPLMTLAGDYGTAIGEIREVHLADGTHLWLNAASALDVAFRPDLRRLHLLAGEVLIDTGHGDARPFVIDTAQGRLQALGTRFSVLQGDSWTLLTVFDGAVRVRPAGSAESAIIEAGQHVEFDRQHIGFPAPAQASRQAWSEGRLIANDIPLSTFIDELQRYQPGYLGISPAAGQLRVVGTFPAHDPARTLSMLESALPIRIKRPLPWWASIELK